MYGLRMITSIFRVGTIKSYKGVRSGATLTDYYLDAKSLLNNVGSGFFNEQLWEEYYYEVIDSQMDKAGNAGQETLLGEDYFAGSAKRHCMEVGKDYNPQNFVNRMQYELGDNYFYAINEIIEECSIELLDALIAAITGDQFGKTAYGNLSNALSIYQARAAGKYGVNWNTYEAAAARSRATATRFLAKNPYGTVRARTTTNIYGFRSAAQSSAFSRRGATRFLKKYPNGIPR